MLDGAADAASHIQLGRNDFAGLAHLPIIGGIARIDSGAAGAHSSAQLVGQRRHDFHELFVGAQSAAARDNDLGGGQLGAVVLSDFRAEETHVSTGSLGRLHIDGSAAASSRRGVKTGSTHGNDFDGITALHRSDGIARVNRALKRVGAIHLRDIGNLRHIQLGCHARGDVLAHSRSRKKNVAVRAGHGDHLRGHVFGQAVGKSGAVGMDYLGHATNGGSGGGGGACVVPGDQHMHIAATLGRSGDGVERGRLDASVIVFGNDERGHKESCRRRG